MAAFESDHAAAAPSISGSIAVDTLAKHIADGRREAAIAQISRVENLSSRPKIVNNATEFVDRMLGCRMIRGQKSQQGSVAKVVTEWICGDKPYRITFDDVFDKPYIIVAEFEDQARIEDSRSFRPPAPPVPIVGTAPPPVVGNGANENLAVAQQFAADFVKGNYKQTGLLADRAHFIFARRDAVNRVSIVEADGFHVSGLEFVANAIVNRLGKPTSSTCESLSLGTSCKFRFNSPDRMLILLLDISEAKITSANFLYATVETLREDMKKN